MWRRKYYQNPKRLALAAIANETKEMTPTISAGLPHLDPSNSEKLCLETLPVIDKAKCPRFKVSESSCGTTVRVFNQDTFDVAIAMPSSVLGISAKKPTREAEAEILAHLRRHATAAENLSSSAARVAVLNMASEFNPGGGWMKGSTAQEEALCYRSSLAASLRRDLYPIPRRAGVYTRDVVIFRESMSDGHMLMVPGTALEDLPVVSVLSVPAIRRPELKRTDGEGCGASAHHGTRERDEDPGEAGRPLARAGGNEEPHKGEEAAETEGSEPGEPSNSRGKGKRKDQKNGKNKDPNSTIKGPMQFANQADRALTKDKMRLCLRMAAAKGHTMLVLGAMGCGAFKNPPQEIVDCWIEVLSEEELAGGWFKEIWFAVYDRRNEGNYEVFRDALGGKVVGEVRASS